MYALAHTCTIMFSLHQIQVRYQVLLQVPIHQASFDHESKRPSARCWGWGKGRLGTGLLFLPKNRSGSGEVVSLEKELCSQQISRMRKRRKKNKNCPILVSFCPKENRTELLEKSVSRYYPLKTPNYKYCGSKYFKHESANVPDVTLHSAGSVL